MFHRIAAIALIAAGLGSCGPGSRPDAAASASRLLEAIVRGDRQAFEAAIDRPAVRDDVRRQLTTLANATGLEIDGGPSVFALDRMITPEAITVVDASSGRALTAGPEPAEVAAQMKRLGEDRACLRETPQAEDCALTFALSDDRWRLVGMKAMGLTIEVAAGD
jgi:hypothetical protein